MTPLLFAAALAPTGPIRAPSSSAAPPVVVRIFPDAPLSSFG